MQTSACQTQSRRVRALPQSPSAGDVAAGVSRLVQRLTAAPRWPSWITVWQDRLSCVQQAPCGPAGQELPLLWQRSRPSAGRVLQGLPWLLQQVGQAALHLLTGCPAPWVRSSEATGQKRKPMLRGCTGGGNLHRCGSGGRHSRCTSARLCSRLDCTFASLPGKKTLALSPGEKHTHSLSRMACSAFSSV